MRIPRHENSDQALGDPQIADRPSIKRMAHPPLGEIDVVGMPLGFSAIQPEIRRHAPMHGEHTDEVLVELGYTPGRIADLRARKLIA